MPAHLTDRRRAVLRWAYLWTQRIRVVQSDPRYRESGLVGGLLGAPSHRLEGILGQRRVEGHDRRRDVRYAPDGLGDAVGCSIVQQALRQPWKGAPRKQNGN